MSVESLSADVSNIAPSWSIASENASASRLPAPSLRSCAVEVGETDLCRRDPGSRRRRCGRRGARAGARGARGAGRGRRRARTTRERAAGTPSGPPNPGRCVPRRRTGQRRRGRERARSRRADSGRDSAAASTVGRARHRAPPPALRRAGRATRAVPRPPGNTRRRAARSGSRTLRAQSRTRLARRLAVSGEVALEAVRDRRTRLRTRSGGPRARGARWRPITWSRSRAAPSRA